MRWFERAPLSPCPWEYFPEFQTVADFVHKNHRIVYPTDFMGFVECQADANDYLPILKDDFLPSMIGSVVLSFPMESWVVKRNPDRTSYRGIQIGDRRILATNYWIGNENWVKIWTISKGDNSVTMEEVGKVLGNTFEEWELSVSKEDKMFKYVESVRAVLADSAEHINIREERNIPNGVSDYADSGYVRECLTLVNHNAELLEYMDLDFTLSSSKIIHSSRDIVEGDIIIETYRSSGKITTMLYRVRWSCSEQIALTPIAETTSETVSEISVLFSKYDPLIKLSIERYRNRKPSNSRLYYS